MSSAKNQKVSQDPLKAPFQLKQEIPVSAVAKKFIEESRQAIVDIIEGRDHRLLLIIGPCSIHDITAAKEYALKVRALSEKVGDSFFVLMRVYFEKPRTTLGWKGLLFDPHLNGTHDIQTGMKWTRQLLLDLAEVGVPAAAEFLDPMSPYYYGDLVSWGCIGARTSESQTHREIASGLPMPVGFKNTTDGNANIAINGAVAASHPHTYIGINEQGQPAVISTEGNPYCHIVLRGGEGGPNYDPANILKVLSSLRRAKIHERVVVDCSHDNSNRIHDQQVNVFESVFHQHIEGNKNIMGFVLESNLFEGCQDHRLNGHTSLKYGVSITDPCLDWETTEALIMWAYQKNHKYKKSRLDDIETKFSASQLV